MRADPPYAEQLIFPVTSPKAPEKTSGHKNGTVRTVRSSVW